MKTELLRRSFIDYIIQREEMNYWSNNADLKAIVEPGLTLPNYLLNLQHQRSEQIKTLMKDNEPLDLFQ